MQTNNEYIFLKAIEKLLEEKNKFEENKTWGLISLSLFFINGKLKEDFSFDIKKNEKT